MNHQLNEINAFLRSLGAIAFASVSVLPMIVLGWLVSAVARSPDADRALQGEAVYKLIGIWMDGAGGLPVVLLLILVLVSLLLFAYLLASRGVGEPGDGLSFARALVQKLLLPMFLSSTGFIAGIVGNNTFRSLFWSLAVFVTFALFAGLMHYAVDTTAPKRAPKGAA